MEIEATKPRTCAPGVCDPERIQGLKAPAPKGDYKLISLKGPGLFLAAAITKQGGFNDLTFVILDIDGGNVAYLSYAAAKNTGLIQQNPYGIVCLQADEILNLTVGYPVPLRFDRELNISAKAKEDGVVQILANVIHGK